MNNISIKTLLISGSFLVFSLCFYSLISLRAELFGFLGFYQDSSLLTFLSIRANFIESASDRIIVPMIFGLIWMVIIFIFFHKCKSSINKTFFKFVSILTFIIIYSILINHVGHLKFNHFISSLNCILIFSTAAYVLFDFKFANQFFFTVVGLNILFFPPLIILLPLMLIIYYPLMVGIAEGLTKLTGNSLIKKY